MTHCDSLKVNLVSRDAGCDVFVCALQRAVTCLVSLSAHTPPTGKNSIKGYVMNRQQALEIASCTQKLASAPCSVSDQNQQHKFSHRY